MSPLPLPLPLPTAQPLNVPQTYAQALALHQQGRLADAERLYQAVMAVRPDHFDTLHMLGLIKLAQGQAGEALRLIAAAMGAKTPSPVILFNHGVALNALARYQDALESFDRAIKLKSKYAEAHNNRGAVLANLGRNEEALESYRKALAIKPGYPEAYSNRGNALKNLNRFDEALVSYERALSLRPDFPEAIYNRGNVLKELLRLDDALADYDRAIALRPNFVEALSNRGGLLYDLKRLDEALASCDRALAVRSDHAEALYYRGLVLEGLKRFDESLASYDRALSLQPNFAEALSNRGGVLRELKRFDEALESCDRALAVQPNLPEGHSTRGAALNALKRFDEALASFDRALALRPDDAEVHYNRGHTLTTMKRFDEAQASYGRAISLRPGYATAHLNDALLKLMIGDFARGWADYEWRLKVNSVAATTRQFAQPLWLGGDAIDGKRILIHCEQGLGDAIQFCRYVPLLTARAAQVIFEVERPLQSLVAAYVSPARVIARGDPLPEFDLQCPLLSLPLAFGTRLETIPAGVPYLHAPSQSLATWASRLGPKARPRIGLAWSGNAINTRDKERSIGLRSLLPLLDGDATFVSLQKDVRGADAALLEERGDILHFGDDLKDFTDTAALISQLDLVVSVDTSVAHLAGALAKPVWILISYIPDWRWLLDRDDSPWYPTVRLFRQPQIDDWDSAIVRVHAALRGFVGGQAPVR